MEFKDIEQKLERLEKETKEKFVELLLSVKELELRVNSHDVSIAKIELMITNLKDNWEILESTIRSVLEQQSKSNISNTSAWKDVTIEAIKTIAIVAGAILCAKIFL